ncbi:DUF6630 family protein [Achromobacter ruhlandii]|uniref:DUF6630 family protein n=1 Tax=Achromobacter ruhlandii TaxID=72557 RepID=UPI000C2633FE|nr:hypothetical protein [Achromobacter ruhlandii]PJM90055.1 hypothetical protein CV044_05315 [Achromobacter ruhlandii]
MAAAPIVMEPLSFDWKTPLPELLDALRQAYAARYPALAAARLDALRAALRDDRADDFLPPLGQELEAQGLALIEQDEDDDAIHLLIVPLADVSDALARIAAQGRQGTRHRQDGAPQGAPAALPRPASGPLAQPGDYLDMAQCVPLAPGWACMANRDTAAPQLVDLHDWPALREVGGKFQPHRGLLASAVAANGVHAWIEQGPDGIASTPYAHLLRAPRVEAAPLNRPGLALPPRAAQAQRRTPEFSLGFAGDDLLLVDRGMVFVYRGFAAQDEAVAIEPALLYTAPPQRRPVSDRSAVIQTPDGRACVLCRGRLLRWRDGQLHPLALGPADAASGDLSHPVACGSGAIAWLEDDALCHADLDALAVSRHAPQQMPAGGMILQSLPQGWLLLGHWHAPHRSLDLGQLWHPDSGQVLRIRHGALDLDSGIQRAWILPDGGVVVGGQLRHVRLGRFDALLGRLPAA